MKKINGIVISAKMQQTAVVSVEQVVVHPLYRKKLKRHKKYKVDTLGFVVKVGDIVTIAETKPAAKGKNFKVVEVAK